MNRTTHQRGDERPRHRIASAALVLVLVLCLAGVGISCGLDEGTVHVVEPEALDGGEGSKQQTDDPSEDLGPVELVRMPDVIGLSSSEAKAQLEAAGLKFGASAHDIPQPGVESDTVTGADPSPGTLVPFGSRMILDIYFDNSTGDESVMTTEDWDRVRIQQEVQAEFGDRTARSYWDETAATLNVQITGLSTDDIERLQSRYNVEVFTVTFSAATIGRGDLQALNQSTKDLVHAFIAECGIQVPRSIGINVETWSVFVSLSSDAVGQSIDECIGEMKEAVLANAADFAKERSIHVDPADLVRFRTHTMPGVDILYD